MKGEVEGTVTVQCLYSAAHQESLKQWCRFNDGQCNTFRRTQTSQKSAVQLSDDGMGSLRVQMSGLRKSDAGWYWCSVGNLQVPVHITVSDNDTGIKLIFYKTTDGKIYANSQL